MMRELAGFDVIGEIHIETITDLLNLSPVVNPVDGKSIYLFGGPFSTDLSVPIGPGTMTIRLIIDAALEAVLHQPLTKLVMSFDGSALLGTSLAPTHIHGQLTVFVPVGFALSSISASSGAQIPTFQFAAVAPDVILDAPTRSSVDSALGSGGADRLIDGLRNALSTFLGLVGTVSVPVMAFTVLSGVESHDPLQLSAPPSVAWIDATTLGVFGRGLTRMPNVRTDTFPQGTAAPAHTLLTTRRHPADTRRHRTTPDDTWSAIPCVAQATSGSGGREAVGVRVSPLAPVAGPEEQVAPLRLGIRGCRDGRPRHHDDLMKRGDVRFAWSGDSAIAYQVLGDGAIDLVYMPPSFSNLDLQWEHPQHARFLDRLASFSRLIIVDRRGWGLSDRTTPGSFPPLELAADDLNIVLDAVGSDSATVFGCAEAGWIATIAAATYPDRYSALVLYQCAATWVRTEETPWNNAPDDWRVFVSRWRDVGTEAFASEWIKENEPSLVDDPVAAAYLARLMRGTIGPGGSQAGFFLHTTTDISAILPAVRVPTLVLYRPENPTEFPQNGPHLASKIPGSRLVALPGADYLPWVGEADALLGEVEEFLTGVRQVSAPDRVLASILFTDIVDSTRKAVHVGDSAWKMLLAEHDLRTRSEIARFRGREIDVTGDGFLATFDGPARAVRAAQAIQAAIDDLGLEIRAGVHTGEVEIDGDQIHGIAVHVGARVAALAGPREVLVSSTVRDLVAGSGLTFESAGEHELKGVPELWKLYRVTS